MPIVKKKRKLFNCLCKSNLVLLEGETGCGKSTQLPQLLCEFFELFKDGNTRPILLIQPRKITTIAIAERIAYEMGEKVQGFVSYLVNEGEQANANSKIVIMLDQLLLSEIEKDPLLNNYSCLVVDEVH